MRKSPAARVSFALADLADPTWTAGLPGPFQGALAFAVLHHLPSAALRRRLLGQVNGILPPGGLFIHSVWQFQHSPRLMARRVPWEQAGIDPALLEPGDTLLDWRLTASPTAPLNPDAVREDTARKDAGRSSAAAGTPDLENESNAVHHSGGSQNTDALRYVHLFSEAELSSLAGESGFRVVESFSSDGEGGRLGLYQVWEKAAGLTSF